MGLALSNRIWPPGPGRPLQPPPGSWAGSPYSSASSGSRLWASRTIRARRSRRDRIEAEWADVVRDLSRLSETLVDLQGKRFRVRTQPTGEVARIVRRLGARLPPVVQRDRAAVERREAQSANHAP